MADNIWRPRQEKKAQVQTLQVTAYDAATTYSLTCGGCTVSTIAAGSVNATATALAAAWNASTHGALSEVTASASTDTVTFTADTAGTPFTFTKAVAGGTGTLGSITTTTANRSPEDAGDVLNWSAGTLPANTENVYIGASSVSLRWNLDALAAVTATSLTIASDFTGTIGLPVTNTSGVSYNEYRQTYLQLSATTCTIGLGAGTGSGRIKLDFLAVQTATTILNSGTGLDSGLPAIILKGTHASNVLNVLAGSVGSAVFGGDLSTWATIRVAQANTGATRGVLTLGAGCTLTTVSNQGGTISVRSAMTTYNQKVRGTLTVTGSGAITTINGFGGSITHLGTGTITTLNIGTGCTVDLSRQDAAITISNCNMFGGAGLIDDGFRGTYSAGIILTKCQLSDVTLRLGANRTLTPA